MDNAANNEVSTDTLQTQLNLKGLLVCNGEHFHLRCCAHILNLVVQEGMKELDPCILKIRESVKYVKGSQLRKQKFMDCVGLVCDGNKRGLSQDVSTRWNSTYQMLESALFYRKAFQHLELSDSNYKHCPSKEEWEKAEKITEFLSVFYDATVEFSGTKYPTANLYFPHIFVCYTTMKEVEEGEDEYLKSVVNRMWTKFDKYWSEFSTILAIASILDPRYKLSFARYAYKEVYGRDSLEFIRLNSKMQALFEEYKSKASTDQPTSSHSQMTSEFAPQKKTKSAPRKLKVIS